MKDNQYLGKLCKRGHEHESTGMSLRYAALHRIGYCCNCKEEQNKKRRLPLRKPTTERECIVCENIYSSNIPQKKTCGKECSQINERKVSAVASGRWAKKHRHTIRSRGRYQYKASRPILFKNCFSCGLTFETTKSNKKYCSENCRRKQYLKNGKYRNGTILKERRDREKLEGAYIKKNICRRTSLKFADVPPELVAMQRERLTLIRLKKEKDHANEKH